MPRLRTTLLPTTLPSLRGAAVCLLLWVCLVPMAFATNAAGALFDDGATVPFQSLDNWSEGETPAASTVSLPWVQLGKSTVVFTHDFFMSEKPADTLYIYMPYVLGQYTLYINDVLVQVGLGWGQPLHIALPTHLQSWQWNKLRLQLHAADVHPWVSPRLLGFGGGMLLHASKVAETPAADSPLGYKADKLQGVTLLEGFPAVVIPTETDTVVVWLPPIDKQGQLADSSLFAAALTSMRRQGFELVYLPVMLPALHLQWLAQLDMRLAADAGTVQVWWQGGDPWQGAILDNRPIWHNADGERLGEYGTVWDTRLAAQQQEMPRWQVVVIVMFGLLMVMLWKLVYPREFAVGMELGGVRTRFGELSRELNFFQKTENPRLPQAVRLLLTGVMLSGLLLLAVQQGVASQLYVFGSDSVLAYLAREFGQRPLLMALVFTSALSVLYVSRQLVFVLLSKLYHNRSLASKVTGIELAANFPQLVPLSLLSLLLLLAADPLQGRLVWVFAILLLLHLLRRFVVLLRGLRMVLDLPASLIFLYICLLEILPWLLVL